MDELADKMRQDPGARSAIDEDRHQRELEIRFKRLKSGVSGLGLNNPCEAGNYDKERG
jgi:hypothetical protein